MSDRPHPSEGGAEPTAILRRTEPLSLLTDCEHQGGPERFDELLRASDLRIERIVSHGHRSPEDFWYDQEEGEWVLVVAGSARLELRDPDELVELGAGDWIDLAPHRPHRVAWTSPDEATVWLAVFYRATPV